MCVALRLTMCKAKFTRFLKHKTYGLAFEVGRGSTRRNYWYAVVQIHCEDRVGGVRYSQPDNALLQELSSEVQPMTQRAGVERTVL
jgi:hypothetical protein